jgi:TatD DNase family protein
MTDSHVHLNLSAFQTDFDAMLRRAQESGVKRMVNIGFDLASSHETASLAERFPFIYGAVGVHPHDAKIYNEAVEEEISQLLDAPRVIAVGEIGLDFYRDLSPRDRQREVFRLQLSLAGRKKRPVIIHCRDAFSDVIDVLSGAGRRYQGIFHAFAGDLSMAKEVLELGFHIGIGGVVTYRNSKLPEVVAELPVESIVLETDCPYLTPVPFRGKRNEPAFLVHIVEKIAVCRGIGVDEVVRITEENFETAMGMKN